MPSVVDVPLLRDVARLIPLGVICLLAGAAGLDLWLELKNYPPLGKRVRDWGHRFPGFMSILGFAFGMMVGHFFFSTPGAASATVERWGRSSQTVEGTATLRTKKERCHAYVVQVAARDRSGALLPSTTRTVLTDMEPGETRTYSAQYNDGSGAHNSPNEVIAAMTADAYCDDP